MVSSVIRSICMSVIVLKEGVHGHFCHSVHPYVIVLKEGVHGQFCHLVCLDVCYCPEREY